MLLHGVLGRSIVQVFGLRAGGPRATDGADGDGADTASTCCRHRATGTCNAEMANST